MGREGEPRTPQSVQGATVVCTELDRLRVCLAMLVISLLLSHSHIFDPEGTRGPSVKTGSSIVLLQDPTRTQLCTAEPEITYVCSMGIS